MHRIDRAAGGRGGYYRKEAAGEDAKAALFPLHIGGAVRPQRQQMRVAVQLGPHHQSGADDKNNRHRPEDGVALTTVAYRITEGEAQCRGDQENGQHLQEVSQRRRVLKRMCGVGIEEAPAVGPQHLDRLLGSDRPHRQQTLDALQRGVGLIRVEVLQRPLLDKNQRQQQGKGQQDPQGDTGDIYPGVTQRIDAFAGKGADQGEDHRHPAGSREKVLHRQADHLTEVAQRALAAVGLPVGVRHKAHGGIQCQMPRQSGQLLWVKRQLRLKRQDQKQHQHAEQVDGEDRQ